MEKWSISKSTPPPRHTQAEKSVYRSVHIVESMFQLVIAIDKYTHTHTHTSIGNGHRHLTQRTQPLIQQLVNVKY